MTFTEAIEALLAVSISAYLGGQKRSLRLKQAIELTILVLDEFDRQRRGITPEQLSMLISWARTSSGGEGIQ